MSAVMDWIQDIFCFTVILSLVSQIVPQSGYLKYIRFFGGIMMAVLVIRPVFPLLNGEVSLEEIVTAEYGELELPDFDGTGTESMGTESMGTESMETESPGAESLGTESPDGTIEGMVRYKEAFYREMLKEEYGDGILEEVVEQ